MNNNRFSTLLKEYINDSHLSVVAISKITKIHRTTIQKFMSGLQLPSNYAIVETIIALFSLSLEQKNQLKRAYMIERIGYLNFQKLNSVNEIIESFNQITSNNISYNYSFNFSKIETFAHNPEEVKLLTHFVLEDAIKSNEQEIYLLMNVDNSLFDIVCSYLKNNRNLKMHQIIKLKNLTNNTNTTNLNQLKKIIPLALFNDNITIKYIYGNDSDNSAFPYLIISPNYVLLINSSYSLGILLDENRDYIINDYQIKDTLARQLIYQSKNKQSAYEKYSHFITNKKDTKNVIYGFIPFFYLWLDLNSLNSLRNHVINNPTVLKKPLGFPLPASHIKHFFPLSKIKEIKNNHLTKPLEKNMINLAITNMIEDIKINKEKHIKIIDDTKFDFPNNLIILSNPTSLSFLYDDRSITIYENTICQDFLLLDTLFEINDYCFDHDDSINYLKKMIEEE